MSTILDPTFPFPHNYELVVAEELPTGPNAKVHYFDAKNRPVGRDGIIVRIKPKSTKAWFGIFAFGYKSSRAVTAVLSCPDADSFCVVSAGRGYFVSADCPDTWHLVDSFPIFDVHIAYDEGLIVFADFTTISAWGRSGFAWKTNRLCRDGLRITSVIENVINGYGYDPAASGLVHFTVDARTGRVEPKPGLRGQSRD